MVVKFSMSKMEQWNDLNILIEMAFEENINSTRFVFENSPSNYVIHFNMRIALRAIGAKIIKKWFVNHRSKGRDEYYVVDIPWVEWIEACHVYNDSVDYMESDCDSDSEDTNCDPDDPK